MNSTAIAALHSAFGDSCNAPGQDRAHDGPPWASEWLVHQAREHRIDAALVLRPASVQLAAAGRLFIETALEAAGIPVLAVETDMVDSRGCDPEAARTAVRGFLDRRVVR